MSNCNGVCIKMKHLPVLRKWCKKIEIEIFDKWLISLDRVTYLSKCVQILQEQVWAAVEQISHACVCRGQSRHFTELRYWNCHLALNFRIILVQTKFCDVYFLWCHCFLLHIFACISISYLTTLASMDQITSHIMIQKLLSEIHSGSKIDIFQRKSTIRDNTDTACLVWFCHMKTSDCNILKSLEEAWSSLVPGKSYDWSWQISSTKSYLDLFISSSLKDIHRPFFKDYILDKKDFILD